MEEERRAKKRRKEALKANETPEERRARRLAKKLRKEAQREASNKLFDYSNDNNPFRDKNLTKMFIWKKKYEREVKQGKDPRKLTRDNLQRRHQELQKEIEELKERRKRREEEKLEMEQMREEQERMQVLADLEDYEAKEDEFIRNQTKVRSEIRIKEGREKAIDILAKNLRIYQDDEDLDANISVDLDVELTEPYRIFQGLEKDELLDLKKDIKEHVDLKEDPDYWNALMTVCNDEIENLDAEYYGRNKYGINLSVQKDITKMLESKRHFELVKLRAEIRDKLNGDGMGVDVAYWEALLKMLDVFEAKASLNDFHQQLLNKRLDQLRKQQHTTGDEDVDEEEDEGPEQDDSDDDEGNYSPELIQNEDDLEGLNVVDEDEDKKQLASQRKMVLEQVAKERAEADKERKDVGGDDVDVGERLRAAGMARFSMTEEELLLKEEGKGMGEDEAKFAAEIPVPKETYWWHDKYRPRKPRYFNRVRTGFEWNKYNQTHYDKENPPPKVVQGYKFNIFYPDLIDPTKAPTYTLHEYAKDPMFAIITFKAGPPYEDIAFKIVSKKWEFGHKRGFKSKFERGVLYLYFNFQRVRYRR
uniref:Splicing factor Cactin n=1 Tax=Lotharella oceanica TaxID=641309 RepID=A0A7S2U3K1_9EUKA